MELEGIKMKVLNEDIQEGQANVERQDQIYPRVVKTTMKLVI